MLVFVDESGDPGIEGKPGSSKYFVVTSVIFTDDDHANKCEEAIRNLRKTLRLHEKFEFHFNKCSKGIRKEFAEAVCDQNFIYYSMVMNKSKLWSSRFKNAGEFYRFTAGIVFDNSKSHLEGAIVVIDKCGDMRFRSELKRHLKDAMNGKSGTKIKKVKMQESKNNDLLQLADMVCGAIARSYNHSGPNESAYRKILRRRERTVKMWPQH